jgi:hypothetical protein
VDKENPPWLSAIMDIKTLKVYPASINALFHLGATGLNIFEQDLSFIKSFDERKKFQVLGLPAPSLFHF